LPACRGGTKKSAIDCRRPARCRHRASPVSLRRPLQSPLAGSCLGSPNAPSFFCYTRSAQTAAGDTLLHPVSLTISARANVSAAVRFRPGNFKPFDSLSRVLFIFRSRYLFAIGLGARCTTAALALAGDFISRVQITFLNNPTPRATDVASCVLVLALLGGRILGRVGTHRQRLRGCHPLWRCFPTRLALRGPLKFFRCQETLPLPTEIEMCKERVQSRGTADRANARFRPGRVFRFTRRY